MDLFTYAETQIAQQMTAEEARRSVEEIKSHAGRAGKLLRELQERQGWKALGYTSWRECAIAEFGQSQRYLYYQLQAAIIEENICTIVQKDGSIPEGQLRPLAKLEPEQQREAWQRAVETAPEGRMTAAHVKSVVDEYEFNRQQILKANRQGAAIEVPPEKRPVSYHVSDDSYDWYTPAEYIEAARGVMGEITLDPASCSAAQQVIQAERYYTKEDDGLLQSWTGKVWMNPPYNMPLIEQFIDKAIAGYRSGEIEAAIILTNNSTDTGWFHKLISYPVCFTRGRIQFWNGDEKLATRQGQAIFYLGDNPELFARVFSSFGVVLCRYDYS